MSALESTSTWAHHNGCSTSPPVETTGIEYSTNADPKVRQSSMNIKVALMILLLNIMHCWALGIVLVQEQN